jgi:HlyD family secretion protein
MKLKLSKSGLMMTAIAVLLVGGVGGYVLWGRRSSAEEFITAKIERGAIRNTVSATGTLQAVTTVQVGSQVSGTISALYADFNSNVKKGQLVAQLDPAIFQAQVASARANLEQARASLADAEAKVLAAKSAVDNQRAGVSGANANLAALKAQRDDAFNLLQRQEALAKAGLIPTRDLESTQSSYRSAEARFNQAAAQLEQARVSEQNSAGSGVAQALAQVKQAKAQVQQTEAAVKLAEVNLSHTTITSPIDGVVVSRNVDVGQTVAASLQAPTLFTIANDLTQMQVIANIDQADIGVISQSNKVAFTVDAFPGSNFGGEISQIRLNPQNVQNVVTYNVVIDVHNPELKLKPGMTANLTMTIAERGDALKIPNAAMRFRPQGMTPDKMRELFRGAGGGDRGAGNGAREAGKDAAPKDAGAKAEAPAAGKGPGGPGGHNGKDAGKGPGGEGGKNGRPGAAATDQQKGAPDAAGRRRGEGGRGAGEPGADGAANRPAASATAPIEGQVRIVWVLGPDKKPQPRRIRIGITDGTATEVTEGELKEGELVIVGQNLSSDERPQSTRPPGFGGGPGGGPGRGPGGFGGGPGGGGGRR